MKLKLTILTIVGTFFIIPLMAQDKFVDSSMNSSKTNVEKHVVDNLNDKVNKGIDNIFSGNAFKKKKKAPTQDNSPATVEPATPVEKGKTQIVVSNTNYQSLAWLTDALKLNVQVTDIEKSFDNGVGTLKITHSCTSDQLLDDLVKKAGDKFDVSGESEGKISLKMK